MVKIDYFELWQDDKNSMLACMYSNLAADLGAGYNPRGAAVTRQRETINRYYYQYMAEYERLREMAADYTDGARRVAQWCRRDLLRRGVIE